MFFVPFILITSFAVINLFIGVIVDAMQSQHHEEAVEVESHAHDERELLKIEIMNLRKDVHELKDLNQSEKRIAV